MELISAKSSIHLPTLETLGLSPSLPDSFRPMPQQPTITSSDWVLSSHLHQPSPSSHQFFPGAASKLVFPSQFPPLLHSFKMLFFYISTDLGTSLYFLKTFHRSPWPLRTPSKDIECPSQTSLSAFFVLKFCYCTSQTPRPSQMEGFAMPRKDPVFLILFWSPCLKFTLSCLCSPIFHSSFKGWLKCHLIHLAGCDLSFLWTSIYYDSFTVSIHQDFKGWLRC